MEITQRAEEAQGQVPLGPAGLLTQVRHRLEAGVREEHHGGGGEHPDETEDGRLSPKTAWMTGCLMPSSPAPAGSADGMNGLRLAALTKNSPATMTKTQMATLTRTSRLVTRADSRMPTMATTPSTSTMPIAPRLTDAALFGEPGARQAEQLCEVTRPAPGHHRRAERELQQQVPPDDPRDDLAHRGVRVGVGAAGGRHAGRQLGVAEGREQRDHPGDGERDHHARPGAVRASMPVRVKMPVPITMPMPKPIRSRAPSRRLRPGLPSLAVGVALGNHILDRFGSQHRHRAHPSHHRDRPADDRCRGLLTHPDPPPITPPPPTRYQPPVPPQPLSVTPPHPPRAGPAHPPRAGPPRPGVIKRFASSAGAKADETLIYGGWAGWPGGGVTGDGLTRISFLVAERWAHRGPVEGTHRVKATRLGAAGLAVGTARRARLDRRPPAAAAPRRTSPAEPPLPRHRNCRLSPTRPPPKRQFRAMWIASVATSTGRARLRDRTGPVAAAGRVPAAGSTWPQRLTTTPSWSRSGRPPTRSGRRRTSRGRST